MVRIDEGSMAYGAINKGDFDQNPNINPHDISPPELMAPGTEKETTPVLTEKALQNRKAFIGYFVQSLLGLAMAGLSFGLSVAATVLTGGAGIPIAAVTGAAFLIAAGDACCALYNLVQVYNDRGTLKTGGNSILLAVKTLMMKCGLGESKAESVGDAASFALRSGLAVSSVLLPFFCPVNVPGTPADLISKVSTGITAILTFMGNGAGTLTDRAERIRDNIDAIPEDKKYGQMDKEEVKGFAESLIESYDRLLEETKRCGTIDPGLYA